ncbi:MAG TPA: OST-HTH/LOTUS domain-containing protein, partial [Trebonia sp.]|nr:OST-HTH/LOTUS domain-containing protein [Trebonia sp.]
GAAAVPPAESAASGQREVAPLEDAADLVVRAIRRLAAGGGESWVRKAGVRPLVKRLDPTFDESGFGFPTFTELLKALDAAGYVRERSGEHDHELAVRLDLERSAWERATLGRPAGDGSASNPSGMNVPGAINGAGVLAGSSGAHGGGPAEGAGHPGHGSPGAGLPGSALAVSGLPETGAPGTGLPGAGLPGAGLPRPGLGGAAERPGLGYRPAGLTGSASTALIERQLRRRGLRLPADRRILWELPELMVRAFGASEDGTAASFDSLRLAVEALVTIQDGATGPAMAGAGQPDGPARDGSVSGGSVSGGSVSGGLVTAGPALGDPVTEGAGTVAPDGRALEAAPGAGAAPDVDGAPGAWPAGGFGPAGSTAGGLGLADVPVTAAVPVTAPVTAAPAGDAGGAPAAGAAREPELVVTEAEFNKVKSILLHARAFTLLGRDRGISLQVADATHLRSLIIGQLLRHLADPSDEESPVLAEAFFGPSATGEQRELVAAVLSAPPADPHSAGPVDGDAPAPAAAPAWSGAAAVQPAAEPGEAAAAAAAAGTVSTEAGAGGGAEEARTAQARDAYPLPASGATTPPAQATAAQATSAKPPLASTAGPQPTGMTSPLGTAAGPQAPAAAAGGAGRQPAPGARAETGSEAETGDHGPATGDPGASGNGSGPTRLAPTFRAALTARAQADEHDDREQPELPGRCRERNPASCCLHG